MLEFVGIGEQDFLPPADQVPDCNVIVDNSSHGKAMVASPPFPLATSPLRGPKLPTIHDLVLNIDAER